MTFIRHRFLVLVTFLAIFSPTLRSEQSQKASRANQEDRLKKLEERADAAEKAASSRSDGKGLPHAYAEAVRVLLSKSPQHTNVDSRNHGTDPDWRLCPSCQIQPENDRPADKKRHGRSHCSNAQRIRAGFSQGHSETVGFQCVQMSRN